VFIRSGRYRNPVLIIATLAFGLTSSGPVRSAGGVTISIPPGVGSNQSETFGPATVTSSSGVNNTILWTQNDISPHTVTSLQVPGGVGSSIPAISIRVRTLA